MLLNNDSQYWLEKYDNETSLAEMVISIEKHGCCSWRYIARWSCDVIKEQRDEALPKVLFDLYTKLAEQGRIASFNLNGQRFFCSNDWLLNHLSLREVKT